MQVFDDWGVSHPTPPPIFTPLDFTIQTDKVLEHRRLDIVVIDKEKKECIIIDLAVPGDQNIAAKEQEKITKYQDLRIEVEKQ